MRSASFLWQYSDLFLTNLLSLIQFVYVLYDGIGVKTFIITHPECQTEKDSLLFLLLLHLNKICLFIQIEHENKVIFL